MIIGIGTDIVEIERIEQALRSETFMSKYFTKEERVLFQRKKAESVAANFAAKEAFSKALGTGVRKFTLDEVEVLRDELGAPYVNLHGSAKAIAEKKGVQNIFLSLSHSKAYAIAYLILEG